MKVSINLGNEDMVSGFDISEALYRISEDLITHYEHGTLRRIVNQTIFDRNGNDVGRWSIDDTEIS